MEALIMPFDSIELLKTIIRPTQAGTKQVKFYFNIFDSAGLPLAPDSAPTIEIKLSGGTVISETTMAQVGSDVGQYVYTWTLLSTSTVGIYDVRFKVIKSTNTIYYRSAYEVIAAEPVIGYLTTAPSVINPFAFQSPSVTLKFGIYDKSGNYDIDTGDLGAGQYLIFRFRGGITDTIDSGVPTLEDAGSGARFLVPVDFENNVFLPGDQIVVGLVNQSVTLSGRTITLPNQEYSITIVGGDVAASGLVQGGSTTTSVVTNIDADDDAFNGMQIIVEKDNASTPDFFVTRNIKSYTASTKTFELYEPLPFTPATGNMVIVLTNRASNPDIEAFKRLMGLNHENLYIVNTFDGANHTGSVIEAYDSKANAILHDGVTGFIAKWTLTITYSGDKPISWTAVLE
jgi:hypothetical protein